MITASHSHLFTLRVWAEEIGDNQQEWRGKLQHVPSGETRYSVAQNDIFPTNLC